MSQKTNISYKKYHTSSYAHVGVRIRGGGGEGGGEEFANVVNEWSLNVF